MTMIRWDPFRDLMTLSDRLNRMIAESSPGGRFGESYGAWVPPVDIFEKGDNLILRVELPGVSRDDIDVRVDNGTLILEGERRRDPVLDESATHRLERVYGNFSRSFALPATVDATKIAASYADGVLEIVLPKSEAAKPKRVEIRAA